MLIHMKLIKNIVKIKIKFKMINITLFNNLIININKINKKKNLMITISHINNKYKLKIVKK
jgi:hypothetical protein